MLFIFAFLFSLSESLACSQQWECSSVTTDYNFVQCLGGKCVCSDRGFNGNASVNNKCRCDSPRSVYWGGNPNAANCISINEAVACQKEHTKEDQQNSYVNQVYQSLIWPTPAFIIQAFIANKTHPNHPIFDLFTEDSKGRVDPVGIYEGRDGDIEYFYGAVWTGVTRIDQVWVNYLISQGDTVYVSVIMHFQRFTNSSGQQLQTHYNLTQKGSFSFKIDPVDGVNKIYSEDLVIPNLGAAVNFSSGGRGLGFGTLAYSQQTCGVILAPRSLGGAGCNSTYDPDGYYVDMADCVNHFMNVYPTGTMDNLWFNGNSVACRYYHLILALIVPEMHCPHVGKTGGGKCINHDYQSYFFVTY
jgi:hypothetical protein